MADKRFAQGGPIPGSDGDETTLLVTGGCILTARQVEAIAGSEAVRKVREQLRGETDGRDG